MIFGVLGPLRAVGLSFAPRQRTVLAVLLLEANHAVAMDRLVDAVWDTEPPPTAREQIQMAVSVIRRALRATGLAVTVVRQAPGYLLRCAEQDLDLLVFDRLVAQARRALAAEDFTGADDAFREALALWRGTPMEGTTGRVVDAARTILTQRWLSAVEEHVDLRIRSGRHSGLVDELTALVAGNPFREKLRARLMTALHHCGRRADALEVYRAGRVLLADELGLDPGPDLVRAERAILSTPSPGPRARAALRAVPVHRPVPRLLPPTSRDFTGRADTVARIRDLLLPNGQAGARIVAVGGRAWSGKTMVAVHAAHALRESYPDGQLFVRLGGSAAQPHEAGDVLIRFLQALGVGTVPTGLDERAEVYRDLTADRRLLVVLDDAADEHQVSPLLPGGSDCGMIVTSRRTLAGLAGVAHVGMEPLTIRQSTELLTSMIGAERVAAQPHAIGKLAEMCQGDPIVLRLAGAQLASRPHWPVATQVDRLTGRDEGWRDLGRDLGQAMTESYVRLTSEARCLLRRIGLFGPGGVRISCRLCGPLLDADPDQADDTLAELADAGLVDVRSDAVCRVSGLVVAFARQRLTEEESLQDRLAATRRIVTAGQGSPGQGSVVVALPTARAVAARDYDLRPAYADR
ncbi:MAG TPA: BTAD domain-containing putative transcriptional regulator [Pseudonocardiaceae bacterium]